MKTISKTSQAVVIAVLLSAALVGGCQRSKEQQPASSGASGESSATDSSTASRAGTSDSPSDTGTSGSSGTSAAPGTSESSGASSASEAAKGATAKAGTAVDDTVITTKVKSALLADSDIKSLDISVETNKGEVMLSGFVKNQAQIDRALKIARGVEGVKGVQNKMSIKTG